MDRNSIIDNQAQYQHNAFNQELIEKRMRELKRESWINNVLRIYPEKTREETEKLHDKLFVNEASI